MFRKMRREKQLLSAQDTANVLNRCTNGILACSGDAGYPYAVPLSYIYLNNKIYYHCGKQGHKMDAILNDAKVSFAVVDEDTIVGPEYTSYFRSVIAFGRARITSGQERYDAFYAMAEKYSGGQPEAEKIKQVTECEHAYVIAIDIDHLTGKEAIEFVRAKEHL